MNVVQVPVADIRIPDDRLRSRCHDIAELADSIQARGLLQPVVIAEDRQLLAGRRRLEAYRLLGRDTITATLLSADEVERRLIEIDENLERQELTVLERCEHLATRKNIYLALYPATKHGGDRRSAWFQDPDSGSCSSSAFVDVTATASRRSPSVIAEEVRIGEMPDEVRNRLRGTPLEHQKSELVRISRLAEQDQARVVERLVSGAASNVRDAKNQIRAEKIQSEQTSSEDLGLVGDLSAVHGRYPCILVDPPWQYRDSGVRGAAERHYPTMSVDELAALPVGRLADAGGCFVWLWSTWPMVGDAAPQKLLNAWGFTWAGVVIWNKLMMGTGHWLRSQTEPLILAVRGKPVPLVRDQPNYFEAQRGLHSVKPEESYRIIERYCVGPRIELFSRRARDGWDRWGLEAPATEDVA